MTAILRRMPFHDRPTPVRVRGEEVTVKAHQIIAWISLTPRSTTAPEPGCPRFPVILDTGNTQTFFIRESHLRRWAGIDLRFLTRIGETRHEGRALPLRAARLWLHRNQPGERDLFAEGQPFQLRVRTGIVIYPTGAPLAPRLPLLGLRALELNRLHLKVNAERLRVSLRSSDWVTRLFGWW